MGITLIDHNNTHHNHTHPPDPPEIELETDRVHSGENKEAHLTCLIQGNPMPSVSGLSPPIP